MHSLAQRQLFTSPDSSTFLPHSFSCCMHFADQGCTSKNARSTLHCAMLSLAVLKDSILSCCHTRHSRPHWSLLLLLADFLRRSRAACPCPNHVLLKRSQQSSADREPRATGPRRSPTDMVGGHCHLPHGDRLSTLPKRGQQA